MPANNPGLFSAGLLILRVGIGIMFMIHGYPKLMGGPAAWDHLGHSMANFHITFTPVAWGFMSAFAETFGGFLICIGLLTRPAAFLLFVNMIVAIAVHINGTPEMRSFLMISHPIELAIVSLAILIAGGGEYSFGHIVMPLRDKWYE